MYLKGSNMEKIENKKFSGERALFDTHDVEIDNCTFFDGESPLKESSNLLITNSSFEWKYPLWYGKNIVVKDSKITETGRAGIWYSDHVTFSNTPVKGPKNFRKCDDLEIINCDFEDAQETLWKCSNVRLTNSKIKGNYVFMGSDNLTVENLVLEGDYGFDTCKNVVIRNSTLHTKDAFWNCENVIVYNSTIVGEYLAWNTKNIRFVNCHIESLQGLCYVKNLVLENCTMANTTLSFEYSEDVNAEVNSVIDSVKNLASGRLVCNGINELIMDKEQIDPTKSIIVVRK